MKLLPNASTNTALVLRNHMPKKQKIVLFDRDLGKIEAVSLSGMHITRICRGALLHYSVVTHRHYYHLHAVEHQAVPFALAREDLLFLHHVVEVIDFFVPFASHNVPLFDLLLSLHHSEIWSGNNSLLVKKLFLVRIFMLLGIYGSDMELNHLFSSLFVRGAIDEAVHQSIHLEDELRIDSWLYDCLHVHPHNSLLKTMHFLRCAHDKE